MTRKTEPTSVTLAEVGRKAGGYHLSTVSLALRDRPGVARAVRELIKKTAKQLGYRRDPLLDAFNRHRTEGLPRRAPTEIAFVAEFATKRELERSAVHWALWRGAEAAARMDHCRLEYFPLVKGGMRARRLDAVLHARGIAAVLLVELGSAGVAPAFTWERYYAVRIGCPHLEEPGHLVIAAMLPGTRRAVRQMRALGYRRIGLVTTAADDRQLVEDARAGVLYEMSLWPAAERVPALELVATMKSQEIKDWLRVQRVDAILAGAGGHRWLATVVGRGGLRGLGRAWLDVAEAPAAGAGIVVDHEMIAAQAVEQIAILRRIGKRGVSREVSVMQVPVGWRDGASLPRRHG